MDDHPTHPHRLLGFGEAPCQSRLWAVLEKIAGRREYDHNDHREAARYKPDQGRWTTDEYLADNALNQKDPTT